MKFHRIQLFFIFFLAFAPIVFFVLNLFYNSIHLYSYKPGDPPTHYSFDAILMEQLAYFSVWTSFVTSCWGIVKILNHFKKRKILWGESENVLTMLFAYNFAASIVFSFGLIFAPSTIPGLGTTFGIINSTLEHWFVPVVYGFYYFIFRNKKELDIKKYAKYDAWKNMIIPVLYAIFIITRCILLNEIGGNGPQSGVLSSFPYEQIDPYNPEIGATAAIRITKTTAGILGGIALAYVLSVIFEFLSFKSSNKFQNRFVQNDILSFKKRKI